MTVGSQLILLLVGSGVTSAALIALLYPMLRRYALARPNARSAHKEPTPQGGGIAVISATIVVAANAMALASGFFNEPNHLWIVFASATGLAIVGAVDDIRTLEVVPRLVLQTVAVAVVIASLPAELRILPALPWWVERVCMVLGGLWFVNLVNFMDGIDWMTVAEIVPLSAALAIFGLLGLLPFSATVTAIALCGAMLGFAPFNRPVARLFLGDVGSLPIGLLLGWLLILLASGGHLTAALLLPLYYLADASITLIRRLTGGEPVWQAHRSHFYQRATDRGFSAYQVVGHVLAVNIGLIALATASLLLPSQLAQGAALAAGVVLVGLLLARFQYGKR